MRADLPATSDILWRLIESRDRAFAMAHESFRKQITAKEAEIHAKEAEIDRLAAVLRERERSLAEKEEELGGLKEKDEEIQGLLSILAERERSLAEKEKELGGLKEKDEEIHSLTREAQARLAIIEQLQASREYKLGVVALHPWRTFKEKL